METRLAIIAAVTIAYFAVMSFITYRVRRHANSSSGMTGGGRNFPAYMIGALMLSEFIGSSVSIGTAQMGFELGISAAWNLVALSTGGGAVLSAVLHINKNLAILLVGAITVLYVSLGGMRSVVYTNVAHASAKYLGMILAFAYALEASGGIGVLQEKLPAMMFNWTQVGWSQIIAWMIAGIGSIFATQYVIQAVVGTDDDKVAKRACYYVASLMIPFGLMAAVVGMASAVLYPGIKSIAAFPVLIAHMPAFSASIMVVGLAGALFGGISATTLASATLAMKDFYDPYFNKEKNDRKSVLFIRVAIIVIGLLPLVLALYADKLLMVAFLGKALRATLAVVVLLAFYAPKFGSPRGAFVGIVVSVIGTIAWFLAGNPFGIDSSYLALAGPLLTMGISELLKTLSPPVALNKRYK